MADETPPKEEFNWNASKYFFKYIEFSILWKHFSQNSQFLSDWEPSEIYISLSFLYKFETLDAFISLNIDIFYIFFVWECLE